MGKSIGIIGAGAWGTAIAQALAKGGNAVQLWTREQEVADAINTHHINKRYLPDCVLSQNIVACSNIQEVASKKEFIILASPSLYLAKTVAQILEVPSIKHGDEQGNFPTIGILTKGFIPSEDGPKLIVETLEDLLPENYKKGLVYISGPSHAEEVATGKLTGLIAASENPKNSIRFRELLKGQGLMVYSSFDVIGVQICAAAKNAIAVIFGCLDALAEHSNLFGDNTESFLLAAGLNEIQTLGRAMGATHPETFSSIAGVGDLDVTCRSKYGRNRRFGHEIITKKLLHKFTSLDDLITRIDEIGYLPEGVVACKYIYQISQQKNIKLPICTGLYHILNRKIESEDLLTELLQTNFVSE
ncbi:MAG: NAD(P)H-dependent glycerol-3-phosphate dehydrogenase [Bacteroidales bacterium]